MPFDKALTLSESLEKIWVDGDLKQRQKPQNVVFPSGLGYDKSNGRVRTPKVNTIFGSNPILSKEISNIKKRRTNSSKSMLRMCDPGRITLCSSQSSALNITQIKKTLKQAWRFFLLCGLFVTQTYSSSDFLSGLQNS